MTTKQTSEYFSRIGKIGGDKKAYNKEKATQDAFENNPYVPGSLQGCNCSRCQKSRKKGVRV